MAEDKRGVITQRTRVTCARCGFRFSSDMNKSRLAAHLRQYGWSDTNEEGWLCGACVLRERAEKARPVNPPSAADPTRGAQRPG